MLNVEQGQEQQAPQTTQEVSPQPEQGMQGTAPEGEQPPQGSQAQQQTPDNSIEQAYKNLQADYTRQGQDYSGLQSRFNQLLEHALKNQPSQGPQNQPAASQSLWDLSNEELAQRLQTDFKGNLANMVTEMANKQMESALKPLQENLSVTQRMVNQRQIDDTLGSLKEQFGKMNNYEGLLNRATEMVLNGPFSGMANSSPAQALQMAFNNIVAQEFLTNPNNLQQFAATFAGNQQEMNQNKMMANPATTVSNANQMPHQPMQQGQNQIDQARQLEQLRNSIATYGMPELMPTAAGMNNIQFQDFSQ